MTMRALILAVCALACTFILGASLWASPFASVLWVAAVMVLPAALIALGALRRGRLGLLGEVLILLTVVLEAGGFALLRLTGPAALSAWIGGLPLSLAVLLYGLCLLPMALLLWAYSATFAHLGLRDEDLERLRLLRSPGRPADG